MRPLISGIASSGNCLIHLPPLDCFKIVVPSAVGHNTALLRKRRSPAAKTLKEVSERLLVGRSRHGSRAALLRLHASPVSPPGGCGYQRRLPSRQEGRGL